MKGIVGFELQVSRDEAAFKLSQNRNAGDQEPIARELEQRRMTQVIITHVCEIPAAIIAHAPPPMTMMNPIAYNR